MLVAHAYLIGTFGLAGIAGLLLYLRRDLGRVMVYSGTFYLVYMTAGFLVTKLLSHDPAKMITPGYWSPPSILNLNRITGGLGIEDVFYMFLVGAIAAALYEVVFSLKVSKVPDKKLKKGYAILIGFIVSSLSFVFTPINAVDFFIILQLSGAIVIVWQRKDLALHALTGGFFFMGLYWLLFIIFNFLFPSFLPTYYHLERTTHLFIGSVPLEELLYSFTLGLMWAPIYEYEHRVKDGKNRRRSLAPRRFSLAAGAARR